MSMLFRSSYRIAVLGGFQTGKTVFTTALLNHIKHHRPELLKLGKTTNNGPIKITFDEELPLYGKTSDVDRFPYEEYRSEASKDWLEKTKATAAYRCSFFRSDWGHKAGELLVVDIPGERYADIPMATRSFKQWSQWLLEEVFAGKDNQQLTEEYTKKTFVSGQPIDADSVLKAYKNTLVRLCKSYRPWVTPSTFLLKENGDYHGESVFDGDIAQACCGLSEETQFAPLPKSVKKTDPVLYAQFEKAYGGYRTKLVMPLCSVLKSVNQLIVLVDLTSLLAGNTAMKNGHQDLLKESLNMLSPGFTWIGRLGQFLTTYLTGGNFDGSGIEKLAVVATKVDKVLQSDLEDDKPLTLLKSMVSGISDRLRHRASGLKVEYFAVAAAKSVFNVVGEPTKKRGVLDGTANEVVYTVQSLPDQWPASWKAGEYYFADVMPVFPDSVQHCPDHIHMDKIMGFLLDFS